MRVKDKNMFGGGGKHGLYTPMSDIEQEVIDRLVSSNDIMLEIVGWGFIKDLPGITFGDLRVSIPFTMSFDRPEVPMPVYWFDLRLKTRTGLVLYEERMSTIYNHQPIQVASGVVLSLVWDIAIQNMDPKVVKMIKPGATGLTSENFDRDTGDVTILGNRKLDPRKKLILHKVRAGEAFSRQDNVEQVALAEAKAKGK